ncbi:MAG: hypothetical protein HQM10_00775 [Candidatus Riflebacteria bacterium]|nr:hypothetical protein [Candidatus Riflebacteria bacterium]
MKIPFRKRMDAFTFIEILIGFSIISLLFLPVFFAISATARDVERCYAEISAVSHAKYVMDTVMFQIPWRCIHEGNPCVFSDPENSASVLSLLQNSVPRMFPGVASSGKMMGDGFLTDDRGFRMRVRLKCKDLENVPLVFGSNSFMPDQISGKDSDGKYNLMKKLILQVKWTARKGVDPADDQFSRSVFLVAVKSDMER